jgi:hypothetical protein
LLEGSFSFSEQQGNNNETTNGLNDLGRTRWWKRRKRLALVCFFDCSRGFLTLGFSFSKVEAFAFFHPGNGKSLKKYLRAASDTAVIIENESKEVRR